jgi:hypothetical protein
MMRCKEILSWGALAATVSLAQAAPGHYAISTAQIATTMGQFGIEVAPQQVKLLADVTATTESPRLVVRSVRPWGNQHLMARLECADSEQCKPFFVGLESNPDDGARTSDVSATRGAGAWSGQIESSKNYVVKSGSPAVLQLDNEHVHIRIAVICLENGAPGQRIRVTGKDHRMIFTAQVVDGSLLKGRL